MNRSTLERLAPLTGVVFVALFVVSFIVAGEPPDADDPAEEVVRYWADKDTANMWAAALVLWGSVLAVWFGASVRTALRRAEGEPGRLSALVLAGWVIFAVGATAFAGFAFAAADTVGDVPPEVTQTLHVLNVQFFPILSLGMALAFLATGVASLRHGGIPRWLGYVAILLGIAVVTPVGFFAFVVGGAWVLVVSVLLYLAAGRSATEA